MIEVVALARALPDTGEHRVATVRLRNVVDQLLNKHGLADARAAEETDLAAAGIGGEQIHDFDASDQNLCLGRLLGIGWRWLVDGAHLDALYRAGLVHRLADDV